MNVVTHTRHHCFKNKALLLCIALSASDLGKFPSHCYQFSCCCIHVLCTRPYIAHI